MTQRILVTGRTGAIGSHTIHVEVTPEDGEFSCITVRKGRQIYARQRLSLGETLTISLPIDQE